MHELIGISFFVFGWKRDVWKKPFPLPTILYQLMRNNDFMNFRFGGTCANDMQEIVTLR